MPHLEEVLARIEKRLTATRLSASAASRLAGKSEAIRNIQRAVESGTERQGVSTVTLNALAPVLGTTAVWLFAGAGPEEVQPSGAPETASTVVTENRNEFVEAEYGGTLQAGSFREVDDVEPARDAEMMPRHKSFPREKYVFFDVVGDSMNAATPPIPSGSQVLAVATDNPYRPIALRTGDIVVVQRKRDQGGLIERSVKELEMAETETRYWPRSTNPKHQPIVATNNPDTENETTVEVLGLVIKVMADVGRG